jgi:hypothetical protein
MAGSTMLYLKLHYFPILQGKELTCLFPHLSAIGSILVQDRTKEKGNVIFQSYSYLGQ